MEDLIIIGGGVAGLAMALRLDKRFKVTIIEKQKFPPGKLCGGMLVEEAWRELAPFAPPDELFHSREKLACDFVDLDSGMTLPIIKTFYSIRRQPLNAWLRSLLPGNITVVDRSRPLSLTPGKRGWRLEIRGPENRRYFLETKYLAGAEGYDSFTRRELYGGYNPPSIFAVQYEVAAALPEKKGKFYFNSAVTREYYIWVFPRKGGFVAGTRIEGKNYKRLLPWIENLHGIKGEVLSKKASPLTMITSREEIHLGREGVFLLGEAAGLVRPSSGEGLTQALVSGRLAAEALNRGGADPVAEYKISCGPLVNTVTRDARFCSVLFNPEKRHTFYLNRQVPLK